MREIELNDIQRRFWIDNQLKEDHTYNVAYAFRIEGDLRTDVLRESLQQAVDEYPPMYSTVVEHGGKTCFVVDERVEVRLDVKEAVEGADMAAMIDKEASMPFDLRRECPCRFTLWLDGKGGGWLLTLFHHMVMDGLTMFDFCTRVSETYNAFLAGQQPPQNKVPTLEAFNQAWQEQYTETERQTDVDYWTDYLADAPLHHSVPIVKDGGKDSRVFAFVLGNEAHAAAGRLCEAKHTTRFRLYAAVWLAVMNHALQQDDLVLDHTVHLRPRWCGGLLGSFVNNLPIRVDMEEFETFGQLLDYMRDNRHREQLHQRATYTDIVAAMRRQGQLDETRELFNVGIDYPIRNHAMGFRLAGCETRFYRQTLGPMLGDVCLVIDEDEDFNCSIRYREGVDERWVERLAKAFGMVMAQVVEDADILLANLRFTTSVEENRLNEESRRMLHAGEAVGEKDTILGLLTDVLAACPQHIALRCGGQSMTYAELDRKSNLVAGRLLQKGWGGQRIGVRMKRGADMVVAVCAVLKAGCAYVPMDADMPQARQDFVVADSDLKAVIDDLNRLNGETDRAAGERMPVVSAMDEAYVIYTSGTTGQPKGVPITHAALLRMVLSERKLFALDEQSVVLQFANLTFDASVTELFSTLAAGATLVVATEDDQRDPQRLVEMMEREGVTCATIPPALLATMPMASLPALQTLIVGGEQTPAEVVERWKKGRRMFNAYGPTENTVDTAVCLMDDTTEADDIGTPLPGVTCYVVDKAMRLVPDGMEGELLIGGLQLTAGYLSRPELNEKKFIPNPFATDDDRRQGINLRLYRSGDRVVRDHRGHLHFRGRIDLQLKLNGHRVEPSEVDACIVKWNGEVRHALTMAAEIGGRKCLVSYVQVDNPDTFDTDALRTGLSRQLPVYMVPAAVIPLREFPLSSSGKIDRRRLPAPVVASRRNKSVPPATTAEVRLATLWEELLPVETIDRDDSFFGLGGDSMAVIALLSRIKEEFSIVLKAAQVYSYPVLKDLAKEIVANGREVVLHTELPMGEHLTSMADCPLPPTQLNLWMECMNSALMKDVYNLPCLFRCPDTTSVEAFEKAFNRLVERQDAFRLSIPLDEQGKPVLHVSAFQKVKVEVRDITTAQLAACVNRDMALGFVLEKGPLYRCTLYHVDGSEWICMLVMHHLMADGWSVQLIENTLSAALRGETVDWNVLRGSYIDYARRMGNATDTELRKQYWREYLKNAKPVQLPQHQVDAGLEGHCHIHALPDNLVRQAETLCRKQGKTAFTLHSLLFMAALARVTGQSDVVAGIPWWGREDEGLEHVVGYFVHTLPLRFRDVDVRRPFVEIWTDWQAQVVAAQEHALSLGKIVEAAQLRTQAGGSGLVRVMFSWEDKEMYHDLWQRKQMAFDLAFVVLRDGQGGLTCRVEYRDACFSDADAARLATAYEMLLGGVADDPVIPLHSLPISTADYRQAIMKSNELSSQDIERDLPAFTSMFAQMVAERPAQVAVLGREQSCTYACLDEWSDQVAQALREAGAKRGEAVAIGMSPSARCVATVIGVLKAGCCYVPLDVAWPEERRAFVLEDAGCRLLMDDNHFPQARSICPSHVVKGELSGCAYVIYTSGTTGQPKGVPITHAALSRLIATERVRFGLSPESRVLLYANMGFDASVTELFTTLSAGATLVVASEAQRRDPNLLARLLVDGEITCATIPPSVLPLLPPHGYPCLNTLIVGGESTPLSTLRQWHKGRTLINAYGPTENTVDTTLCVVDDSFEANDIGTPLPGVACYVLDEAMNIVPDGLPGQLYIGGLQLTPGYLNRPELNKEVFVPNPYVTPADQAWGVNTRLYKSGDLVRRRPDGHLIFMGRIDNQVKLHGFRIELAEIEAQMQRMDGVRHAVAVVRKQGGQDVLAAYVQPQPGQVVDVSRLRAHLKEVLPVYMLPGYWKLLDSFPLTVNGKIDVRALPEPEMWAGDAIVAAEGVDEQTLLSLACDVLGATSIGVETDLLDAGMTSMQVMEFVSRAAGQTRQRITVSEVYCQRTIRRLLASTHGQMCHWVGNNDPSRLVMVCFAGFAPISPAYDKFLHFFMRHYSILAVESFNELFMERGEMLLDELLLFYESVLENELRGREVFLTGYCVGTEMALAYALHIRQKHPQRPPYKVLNLDAVYLRDSEVSEPSVEIHDTMLAKRIYLTDKLYLHFPSLGGYDGSMIILMAGRTSRILYKERGEETDKQLLAQVDSLQQANIEAWQKHYPDAPFYLIECDHWNFMEDENVFVRILEIIRKHWGL